MSSENETNAKQAMKHLNDEAVSHLADY